MSYETLDVPVDGGSLRVGRWTASDPQAPVVLAAHGVTANHRCWALVAEQNQVSILAPDLRGRGRSAELDGAAGISRHAADLLAVVDAAGQDRVALAGHSMGGFVVSEFARRHPDRVAGVVLIDGGLPLPAVPEGVTPEQALAATIGPAADRLTMTFASRAAYLDFWRDHPAVGPAWSPAIEDYLTYDLVGDPPECRSCVSLEAVTDDSRDLLDPAMVETAARALPAGSVFLRAPAGLLAEPGGLYPPDLFAAHRESYPELDLREVEDVNHYTVVLGDGAKTVSETLQEVAGR
ncbi:MAG TPA: alpha/beta hydrolase [Nocardioidaceae bacterium]|nr:alpha/beta hydrolase [Nocardioidaceae bacterium]